MRRTLWFDSGCFGSERVRCRLGAALVVIIGVALGATTRPVAARPATRSLQPQAPRPSAVGSVLDGVFTSNQAARGQSTFQKACASCHAIADQTGRRFVARWRDGSVGDVFDMISNAMPEGDPGGLKPEEYAAIVAFYLKETGYPEGKQELPATLSELARVRIEPPRAR